MKNCASAIRFFITASVANYDGYDVWGENQHRFFTNNLGYKDAAVRAVAPECATRRILLIGDSFTEGIGLSFEDSFAGLLFQAGKQLEPPVEFLNAGVISYSPSLYYKKVRHLVEHGWCVNEVVVFPDLSDIPDEAVGYFCFDDDPKYHRYCNPDNLYDVPEQWTFNKFLQRSFKITDRVRLIVKHYLIYDSERIAKLFNWSDFTGWADAGCDTGNGFKPLGVESGIARALQNMGRLADYLAQKEEHDPAEHRRLPLAGADCAKRPSLPVCLDLARLLCDTMQAFHQYYSCFFSTEGGTCGLV
ncbi:MAG: hypothetical protein R3D62_12065 [Xanthobacteraceae bacterium]